MSVKNPCKYCKDRYLGCHGKCDKYKEFKNSITKANNERYRQGQLKAYQVDKALDLRKKIK